MTLPELIYKDSESDLALLVEHEPVDVSCLLLEKVHRDNCAYEIDIFPGLLDAPEDEIAPVTKFNNLDFPRMIDSLTRKAGITIQEFGQMIYDALIPSAKECYDTVCNDACPAWEIGLEILQDALTELASNGASHGNELDPNKNERVDLGIYLLPDGSLQFMAEVIDQGGYHDFRMHRLNNFAEGSQKGSMIVDDDKRHHGDLIVNQIGWTRAAVANYRGGLEKEVMRQKEDVQSISSVIYTLVFRPTREAPQPC